MAASSGCRRRDERDATGMERADRSRAAGRRGGGSRARRRRAGSFAGEQSMAMQLKDVALGKRNGYDDGPGDEADSGRSFRVTDPASGQTIAEVSDMGVAETKRAIDAAARALPAWRAKTAKERGAILRRWYELVLEHADDLALLMTTEQGKPLAEARGEVGYGASFIEWFAEEGRRVYGDVIPTTSPDRRLLAID